MSYYKHVTNVRKITILIKKCCIHVTVITLVVQVSLWESGSCSGVAEPGQSADPTGAQGSS